jgi:hypothetical protein
MWSVVMTVVCAFTSTTMHAAELRAGAAKVDITHPDGPVSGPLCRALIVTNGDVTPPVTLDVVSLGEIGYIKNDFSWLPRADRGRVCIYHPNTHRQPATYGSRVPMR